MPSVFNPVGRLCEPIGNTDIEPAPYVWVEIIFSSLGKRAKFIGIVDTGADRTVLTQKGFEKLCKLKGAPSRLSQWWPLKGSVKMLRFPGSAWLRLGAYPPFRLPKGIYYKAGIQSKRVEVCLGRDMLSDKQLIYCGVSQSFQLWV